MESLLDAIVDKIENKVEAKVEDIEDIVEKVEDIDESKGRYPRMTGPEKDARDKRDQKALARMVRHASFCAADVGLQVLSLSSSLRNILFPE